MILIAAAIALFAASPASAAPASAPKPDMTAYLASRDRGAIPEDIR